MTLTVSPAAIALIERFENDEGETRPTWPGGQSGITIGYGYDLGYVSATQVAEDWAELPPTALNRLCSYAGRKGAQAQMMAATASDIVVPLAVARRVFETVDIPRWTARVTDAFENCDQLSGDSLGALVSLAFNRGLSMTDTQPPGNRQEMRDIRDAMAAKTFASIPNSIRSMKRLWVGKGLDGLLIRRDAEADLFQKGLTNGC